MDTVTSKILITYTIIMLYIRDTQTICKFIKCFVYIKLLQTIDEGKMRHLHTTFTVAFLI